MVAAPALAATVTFKLYGEVVALLIMVPPVAESHNFTPPGFGIVPVAVKATVVATVGLHTEISAAAGAVGAA